MDKQTEAQMIMHWNKDFRCMDIIRVIYIKQNFILDKTHKIVQEAEMRTEPGKETSLDCYKDKIKQNKEDKK